MGLLAVLFPIAAISLLVWYVGPRNFPEATARFLQGLGRFFVGWIGIIVVGALGLFALLTFCFGLVALLFGQSVALFSIAWSVMLVCMIAIAALVQRRRDANRHSDLFGNAHFCSESETAALHLFGQSGIPIGSFLKIEPEQAPVELPLFPKSRRRDVVRLSRGTFRPSPR